MRKAWIEFWDILEYFARHNMVTILPSRDAFRMEICGEGMPVHSLPKLKSGEGIPSLPSPGSTALSIRIWLQLGENSW